MKRLIAGLALASLASAALGQVTPGRGQQPRPNRPNSSGVGFGLSINLGGKKKPTTPPLEMRDAVIDEYVAGEVIFVIDGQGTNAEAIARKANLAFSESAWLDESGVTMVVAALPLGDTVPAAIARLEKQKGVAFAQPNYQFQLLGKSRPKRFDLHVIPEKQASVSGSIVMIDAAVDAGHANLSGASITQQYFGTDKTPAVHGTAIAALLVGTGSYPGTAQGAKLTSLAAFGGSATDTVLSRTSYLAKAVNEASRLRPDVLNLSFGGPQDKLLGITLDTIRKNGVCVSAAAGNGGPGGAVLFPASHPSSLAVTAVDEKLKGYAYASQGARIDIAGVGVGVNAAAPGGRRAVSGTSFATAVISGALLRMPACNGARNPAAMKEQVAARAQDLGAKGHDAVFGNGLFRLSAPVKKQASP
jgi:Subtilase family